MSVDCTAKIVYGWLIDNDEAYDYNERMRARNMDTSDYFQCINAYSHDTDYVYGIEIMRSNYPCIITNKAFNSYLFVCGSVII